MNKRAFYHIAFWIGYVLFKTYLNVESDPFRISGTRWLQLISAQLVFLIVKVPVVYTLFYIIEKYLARQWNILKTVLHVLSLFILGILSYLALRQFIILEIIYKWPASFKESFRFVNIFYTAFVLGFICSLAVAIKLVRSNIRQRKVEQEVIKTKLETELRFLKAQINPHFLFNTLNNIYALARKKSDETAGVVMKLSKLFRFILYESQKYFISIADEIHVLENYIELESIRYDEKLKISFTRSIDDHSQPIAPLILLPFVENTFKHGASESRFSSYINIELRLSQKQLSFVCENSKTGSSEKKETERIGLGNIRRQLELLYPEHKLEIENTETFFRVSLKINFAQSGVNRYKPRQLVVSDGASF